MSRSEEEEFFHFKTDIFKGIYWYICKQDRLKFVSVPVKRVKEVQELNEKGEFPEHLIQEKENPKIEKEIDYLNVVGQDDLTRFDKLNKKKKRPKNKRNLKNKQPSNFKIDSQKNTSKKTTSNKNNRLINNSNQKDQGEKDQGEGITKKRRKGINLTTCLTSCELAYNNIASARVYHTPGMLIQLQLRCEFV